MSYGDQVRFCGGADRLGRMARPRLYFEFEVGLLGVKPRIWRRFVLRADASFHELHDTLQAACGWQNYHLYEFTTFPSDRRASRGEMLAVSPYWEPEVDEEVPPYADELPIRSVFQTPGDVCLYLYDFGDGWRHRVELVGVQKLSCAALRRILGGERAFPPEDCGSISGYGDCLKAMEISATEAEAYDPQSGEDMDLERQGLIERKRWLGDWHPERCDLEAIARAFRMPVDYGEDE